MKRERFFRGLVVVLFTLLFVLVIVFFTVLIVHGLDEKETEKKIKEIKEQIVTVQPQTTAVTTKAIEREIESTTATTVATTSTGNLVPMALDMSRALFIGDSRTVGIHDTRVISEATFFAKVGATVFDALGAGFNVEGWGQMTLDKVLTIKSYNYIYIMYGVNELGSDDEVILNAYKKLVDKVRTAQPWARVFVMANLHMSASFSEKRDDSMTNEALDVLNEEISKFADEDDMIYYIDANELFDDYNHAMKGSATGDGLHPKSQYYAEWAGWLLQKTCDALNFN